MDGGILRQLELTKSGAEFLVRLIVPLAHVNQLELLAKAVPHAFPFRQHLEKAGRKRAGHGHGTIRGLDHFCAAIFPICAGSATHIAGQSLRLSAAALRMMLGRSTLPLQ
jgi:hypothetical protein